MSKNIILSEKHGVNSSITVCPICGKEIGSALNIPVKGYMTLIKENEFDKVFKH